jgi:hypothetical protein
MENGIVVCGRRHHTWFNKNEFVIIDNNPLKLTVNHLQKINAKLYGITLDIE